MTWRRYRFAQREREIAYIELALEGLAEAASGGRPCHIRWANPDSRMDTVAWSRPDDRTIYLAPALLGESCPISDPAADRLAGLVLHEAGHLELDRLGSHTAFNRGFVPYGLDMTSAALWLNVVEDLLIDSVMNGVGNAWRIAYRDAVRTVSGGVEYARSRLRLVRDAARLDPSMLPRIYAFARMWNLTDELDERFAPLVGAIDPVLDWYEHEIEALASPAPWALTSDEAEREAATGRMLDLLTEVGRRLAAALYALQGGSGGSVSGGSGDGDADGDADAKATSDDAGGSNDGNDRDADADDARTADGSDAAGNAVAPADATNTDGSGDDVGGPVSDLVNNAEMWATCPHDEPRSRVSQTGTAEWRHVAYQRQKIEVERARLLVEGVVGALRSPSTIASQLDRATIGAIADAVRRVRAGRVMVRRLDSGRLDRRALPRAVALGRTDVYRAEREPSVALTAAILLDLSGSVANDRPAALSAALHAWYGLREAGVEVWLLAYNSRVGLSLLASPRGVASNFLPAEGTTPSATAIDATVNVIPTRVRQPRLLVHVTDGQPDIIASARAACDGAVKAGWTVVTAAIGDAVRDCRQVYGAYGPVVACPTYAQVPAVVTAAVEALLRERASVWRAGL
jgi:hypothetical protein